MAESETEIKTSLKLLVDEETNKVVFSEASKDFVDFLFQLMSLPLSRVTKLVENDTEKMSGGLGTLYKSIESLNIQHFDETTKNNKDSVLNPKAFVTVPLLSVNDVPSLITFYRCDYHRQNYSVFAGTLCHCGKPMPSSVSFERVSSRTPMDSPSAGYVKNAVSYIVMDNLEVKPMSVSLIMSIVKNYRFLKEIEVQVGQQEGIALLKASLEKKDVLTSVFLKNKNKTVSRAC